MCGNGELLAHLCDAYPNLRGALLDRPEVISAARASLDARGLLNRCTFHPGSFIDSRDLPADASPASCTREAGFRVAIPTPTTTPSNQHPPASCSS
ncbi:methyltransferase [Actinomadura sp. 1N219]|uniref:methyltransferase n=1 Tax=Actinomadura sp. 1N219 TaxID=3375152 RepID=UPI0037A70A62